MNARYYLPETGRFLSADTIIPDPTNPQTFNRYSYVYNNPINLNDPTGHCGEGITFLICGGLFIAFVLTTNVASNTLQDIPETNLPEVRRVDRRPIATGTISYGCQDTLSECHKKQSIMEFEDGEQIDPKEFEQLLNDYAEEMYYGWTPSVSEDPFFDTDIGLALPYLAGRGAADSPFYNGGGGGTSNLEGIYDANQQVCFSHGCYGRSEVNYFVQGMWSAAAGESIEDALALVQRWHDMNSYPGSVPKGKFYWTAYGYAWYLNWLEQQKTSSDSEE